MNRKVSMTFEQLEQLSVIARANGTQDAFVDVALEWAKAANDTIARMRRDDAELLAAVKEVLRISDRDHDAWKRTSVVISRMEA